ncbi:MAG: hypothetical protein CVV02_15285 [Firmicutes bacterium HGW-Firmicutes-7]|nr:MAG: hypothetical protein CVV02_15285 [Firmicutes bacterium HGW-Firmicutes-7]
MSKLPVNEILSISKLVQMETSALAVSKAGLKAITDEELRTQAKSGIHAGEARIKGLQQFIVDNDVIYHAEEGTTI